MNDDAISRQAAVVAVRDTLKRIPPSAIRAMTAIRELPSVMKWTLCSEQMPEEKINQNTQDFEFVLCSTTFGDVRPYKFGKLIGWEEAHFWHGGEVIDKYVVAWMPLPEPYREGGKEADGEA